MKKNKINTNHEKLPYCALYNSKTTYSILLPDSDGKYEKSYETEDILDALDYAYGVGPFIIQSSAGLNYNFIPEEFTVKQCHNAGFIEPFDFVIHAFLTELELNNWKLRIRSQEMY